MAKILLFSGFIILCIVSSGQVHHAELVLHETNITVANHTLTREVYYEIRINDRAGEKYSRIKIPYRKIDKTGQVTGYIKDAGGNIVKRIKKSDITDRSMISDISFYEDYFMKEFTLKHNTYPYTIVYSYQVQQSRFIHVENWLPVIDETIPTLEARLNVSVPSGYPIRFINRHVKEPVSETVKDIVTWRWKAQHTDLIKSEAFAPPELEFYPSVVIVPQNFNFGTKGSFKDWTSFGDWQYELLTGMDDLPPAEKSKILSLIKDISNEKEKIRVLYHFLQDETRYINITIETGGLKPYPASYVAQNKYGDCKALSNYFKSALACAGIKAHYALVHAGSPTKEINKDFPSQQFNHVILYVPLDNEEIWLDCTSDGAFNYLGTFTQNRDVLIIDKNNSHFLKTPVMKPDDVAVTRKIRVNYETDKAGLNYHNIYKADMYESLLALDNSFNESDKQKILKNYFADDRIDLINYQVSKPHRDSLSIMLSGEAVSRQIYRHYGNDILVNNIPFQLPSFEKPAERKCPVQIDAPIYKTDTLVYEIPAGYRLNTKAMVYDISGRFGRYTFNMYEEGNQVSVVKSILVNPGHYPLSDYEALYDFMTQVTSLENKTHISLTK